MDTPAAIGVGRALANPRFQLALWAVAASVGWAGVVLVALGLRSMNDGALGFDLELVLEAGRRVARGELPYDPTVVAGTADLDAQDLFYSYPPPLAQLTALAAGVPSTFALVVFGVLGIAAFVGVAFRLARAWESNVSGARVLVPLLGVLPFVYPMTVALLFGNLDVWYPALYGLVLLAALPGADRLRLVAGGASLAVLAITKIHPALLGLWFLIRATRDRSARLVLAATLVVGLAIVGLSLATGGIAPWQAYASALSTISGADLVLRNNIAPAAQIALWTGQTELVARQLHVLVAVVAISLTAWTAWRSRDLLVSLGVATIASIVLLPVTWFHYPVALLPFGVAALARSREGAHRRVGVLLMAAVAVSVASVLLPVLVWLSVACVLAALARPDARAPSA